MTTTRERLAKQRQALVGQLRHAELLATHTPTREALDRVRQLRTALGNLDDIARAATHHIVKPSTKYEPSSGPFITAAELAARQGLATHRNVCYLN